MLSSILECVSCSPREGRRFAQSRERRPQDAFLLAHRRGCKESGICCLIVDLDQWANITRSLPLDHREPTGVEPIFSPDANPEPHSLVCRTRYDAIDIIPMTGLSPRRPRSAGAVGAEATWLIHWLERKPIQNRQCVEPAIPIACWAWAGGSA